MKNYYPVFIKYVKINFQQKSSRIKLHIIRNPLKETIYIYIFFLNVSNQIYYTTMYRSKLL